MADLLRLPDEERRFLVLAGMAVGLAAIFRSPLGMAIFAVEILYAGTAFESEALIYTAVASVVAYAVNGLFVGWSPIFLFPQALRFTRPLNLVGYALLGVVAGLVGAIEPIIFYGVRDFFKKLRVPNHVKPAIGGLLMGLLALVVPQTLSTGYGWVQKAMTGGYGLIVPSMLATAIAFVIQRTVGARFRYPRLYEAQVELRKDSPTHHQNLVQAAFEVLERGLAVDLREVTFPQLNSLLRHGNPIPIHSGQAALFTVNISKGSDFSGQTVVQVFGKFADLVAVAVIRDQQVQLPKDVTRLEAGDQLIVAATEAKGTGGIQALG